MSEEMIDDDVAVAPIDRLAAAALVKWQIGTGWEPSFFHSGLPKGILEGVWDNHPIVQAFAWHRVSAYNPNERLRDALLGAQKALVNLADEGAISSRAPILKFVAAALSPLPQGED